MDWFSWFWSMFIPVSAQDFYLSRWLFPQGKFDVILVDNLLYLGIGIIFLVTLPLVTRGLTTIHWLVARGVLAAFKSDALLKEVADLTMGVTVRVRSMKDVPEAFAQALFATP